MPTVPQITAAKTALTPQPYDANASALTSDSVQTLHKFLRKYLYDNKKTGRYADTGIKDALAAAVGIDAASLQAVLQNVSDAGSKKAKLNGEVEYFTQDTIDNELEFALFTLFMPVQGNSFGGSKPSEVAAAIRKEFRMHGTYRDEFQKTRCND